MRQPRIQFCQVLFCEARVADSHTPNKGAALRRAELGFALNRIPLFAGRTARNQPKQNCDGVNERTLLSRCQLYHARASRKV